MVEDGFLDMIRFVDEFKKWEKEGNEGELRTFSEFKKQKKPPRTFTASKNNLCYVASVRTAASLLGVSEILLDRLLEMLWAKHPLTKEGGISWQDLTKLVAFCNESKKRTKNDKGITFGVAERRSIRLPLSARKISI